MKTSAKLTNSKPTSSMRYYTKSTHLHLQLLQIDVECIITQSRILYVIFSINPSRKLRIKSFFNIHLGKKWHKKRLNEFVKKPILYMKLLPKPLSLIDYTRIHCMQHFSWKHTIKACAFIRCFLITLCLRFICMFDKAKLRLSLICLKSDFCSNSHYSAFR